MIHCHQILILFDNVLYVLIINNSFLLSLIFFYCHIIIKFQYDIVVKGHFFYLNKLKNQQSTLRKMENIVTMLGQRQTRIHFIFNSRFLNIESYDSENDRHTKHQIVV